MVARKKANGGDGDGVELAQLPAPVQTRPGLAAGESVQMMPPAMSARVERMERDVEDVMSEVGGSDVTVKVMRRGENGAMYACGTMTADTFTVEALTDAYGGGSYQLRFMRGRVEIDRATVEVDPLIPARNPRMPRGVPGAPAAPATSATDITAILGGVVSMMATMAQTNMSTTTAMMAGMAEMVKTRQPSGDPVETALRIAEALRPASQPQTPVSEALSLFREGMKMGQGKDGDSDSVMPVIAEGVRAVGALAQAAVEEKRINAHAARQALQPAAATATATVAAPPAVAPVSAPVVETPATDTTMTRVWHLAAAPYKGVLVTLVGKTQPGNAAAMILDMLNDDQLSDLAADIESDGPEAFAARSVSLFGLRDTDAGWLAELAAEVLAQSEADEPEAGAESPVVS